MDKLIGSALARLRSSLVTWPDPAGWAFAFLMGAATLSVMGAIGFSSGLYHLTLANTHGLAMRLATTLIAPAIGEEAFFRGLMVPDRRNAPRPWVALTGATLVFIAWHVVEATTFLTAAAPVFLRPDFLVCAGVFGLGAGVIRWRTGSLWPGVGLHWLLVALWQTWFGGFTLGS